ncbi:hypothetical protein AMATHDRAFT_46236 [Amanita thiersii Skay4041]|uniref:Cytochrome b561 domain-containing protein n=1 Tax=Amanita thiersii Skay4041 TaxID=703135 RepID=A0A2A9NN04_9AGAR|nr:hypothetical protein AMATHDRAFT_46236 [Amanita thiersii Skay4041]
MRKSFLYPVSMLLAGLQAFVGAVGMKGDSKCGRHMCMNATLEDGWATSKFSAVDEFTNLKDPMGWVALGFGERMIGSHMVILWPNDDGTTTLSHRFANDFEEPVIDDTPPHHAVVVYPKKSWQPKNSTVVGFKVPVARTDTNFVELERLIWAYSKTRPSSNSPDATISYHTVSGLVRFDFSKDIPTIPISQTMDEILSASGPLRMHERLAYMHGLLLTLAFLFFLPMGILCARFFRTMSPTWLRTHYLLNATLAVPTVTIGAMLSPVAILSHGGSHFAGSHQIYGIILLSMYGTQISLAPRISKWSTTSAHISHKYHAVFGAIFVLLALYQVQSGWAEWDHNTMRLEHSKIFKVISQIGAWVVLLSYAYGLVFTREAHPKLA